MNRNGRGTNTNYFFSDRKRWGILFLFFPLYGMILEGQSLHTRVLISANTFQMGGNTHETEKPIHRVTLEAFEIDLYEVTNQQFALFIENGGYQNKQYWSEAGWNLKEAQKWAMPRFWKNPDYNQPKQPVVGISWYEAEAYCRWQGENTRLPTEAEWEYVASNGGKFEFPWGGRDPEKTVLCHFLNLSATHPSVNAPLPVGCFEPSKLGGIYDLSGNVWEWCSDWYGKTYYSDSQNAKNPTGPVSGSKKVLRGGAFNSTKMTLRAKVRYGCLPQNWYGSVGFRTVRSISLPYQTSEENDER